MNDEITRKYVLLSTDDDGTERRQYPDGTIRNQYGQMLVLPDKLRAEISQNGHERQIERHRMRKERILHAIEEAITDLTKTNIPADAIAAIVRKRAEIAMKDETRIGNEAAKLVLQVVDAYQEKAEGETRTNVLRHEYSIDDETRELFERMMRQQRGDDEEVIDG